MRNKIYVAYQLNFDSLIQRALSLAKNRKIFSIEASQRVLLNSSGWKADRQMSGGGTLLDNSSHFINLAVNNFGYPRKVFATFPSEKDGIEKLCDVSLFYQGFIFKIHSDWKSSVGKENLLTIYTDKYDIYFKEDNRFAELFTASSRSTAKEVRRATTHYYLPKGLDRSMAKDPFNRKSEQTAVSNMIYEVLSDLKKDNSEFYRKQIKAAMQTNEIIEKIYKNNTRLIKL